MKRFIIRREQMAVFSGYMVKTFEDTMVAALRKHSMAATKEKSDADLRAFVQDGISHAAQYGIDVEEDVRRFVFLRLDYGTEFDKKEPAIQRVLKFRNLSGSQKLERITSMLYS